MLTVELMKLLKYGFNLDNFDDFDQANIMDAQMDEALQNAANCNTNSTINIPSTSSFSEELSNNIIENNNSLITSNSNKNISSATDGLRKLAEKCRNIRNIFEQNRDINTFIELLQHCQIDSNKLLNYMNKIEEFPDSNTKLFRECLSVISKRSPLLPYKYVNVILSFNQIECGVAGVLGRLMLCRMSEFIEAENVFCITRNGKEAVFERLINQFQKKLILLITTSEESRKIANKLTSTQDFLDVCCCHIIIFSPRPAEGLVLGSAQRMGQIRSTDWKTLEQDQRRGLSIGWNLKIRFK
ncbi:hypothetical protein Mgra_00008872 [Meloidogyne graminicola]|nr:hypothetical protein Mgra_00008872 [Meloidogyne graminicola]